MQEHAALACRTPNGKAIGLGRCNLNERLASIFLSSVESLDTGQGRHSSFACLQKSSETRRQLLQPLHGRSRTTRDDKGLGFKLQHLTSCAPAVTGESPHSRRIM